MLKSLSLYRLEKQKIILTLAYSSRYALLERVFSIAVARFPSYKRESNFTYAYLLGLMLRPSVDNPGVHIYIPENV